MEGPTGWLVSKNHNKVAGEWRVWGATNSESPDSGYRAADITGNLTTQQADAYSTYFNTNYVLGTNLQNVKNVTIKYNATLDTNSTNNYALTSDHVTVNGTFQGRASSVSMDSLTIYSSGLFNATSGTTAITSESSDNYAFQCDWNGRYIANSGTFNITTPDATRILTRNNANDKLHNLNLNTNNQVMLRTPLYTTGDLKVISGNLETFDGADNWNTEITGAAIVSGIFYGRTGNHTFGSLTVNSGGAYQATSGVT